MEDRVPPPMVEAARNGDSGALAILCERLYPRIFRYLAHKVNDPRDAEDLAGEVLTPMAAMFKKACDTYSPFRDHDAHLA